MAGGSGPLPELPAMLSADSIADESTDADDLAIGVADRPGTCVRGNEISTPQSPGVLGNWERHNVQNRGVLERS